MNTVIEKVQEVKKALTAAAGGLAMLVANGAIPDPERGWAISLLALLTALGVYQATNKP